MRNSRQKRHDCVQDTCTWYVCVRGLCVVHVLLARAVLALCCAALRVAPRRACRTACIHSFIHMPTQGHSASGYTGTHT